MDSCSIHGYLNGTWVHHFTPETKEQLTEKGRLQRRQSPFHLQERPWCQFLVFWDARGVIFIDDLEKRKTITSEYWANLLQRLSEEINIKRSHLAKKKVFHQDNAPVHISVTAMVKINELNFELLCHAPYSPDPLGLFSFPNLEKKMA
ncbi:mariner transposase [Trichonephila clavipes]|nr:mariner transposase [Trichonephila clavipes]